jgi:tryptophanyl-tRNA synthetase
MRPTGPQHLGHLVGALQSWVSLQDDYDCYYVIVDWHALTTDYANTAPIRAYVREVATRPVPLPRKPSPKYVGRCGFIDE